MRRSCLVWFGQVVLALVQRVTQPMAPARVQA